MGKSDTTLIAIGGGELAEAPQILDEFFGLLSKSKDSSLVVMTVATNQPEAAADKYRAMFQGNAKHVHVVDVSSRDDGFNARSLETVRGADALFFTGGDQLNVTALMGGTPLDVLIDEKLRDGLIIAGTSAGAAMMSSTMITSGGSGNPPMAGGVDFAPGMNLIDGTIVDTHFSQRARHGRLLTAVAHYPEAIGLGIDEKTAMVVHRNKFKVLGNGVVTVVDGSPMHHCDLAYRKKGGTIGMFGTNIHVLPSGYSYDLRKREPIAPAHSRSMSAAGED